MTRYWAGPWQWQSAGPTPHYHAPSGASALVDLRNIETQSAGNHAAGVGNGFFCTPDDVSLPSEYELLGQGYITEVTTNNAVRSAWQSLYGVNPQGERLIDYLAYTLGDGSDPDGATGPKPIIPGVQPVNEVLIELAGHSVVHRRVLNIATGTRRHEQNCRTRIQKDLADIADTDETLFRKCLGKTKEKFGLKWDSPNEAWLLNAKTRGRSKGSNGRTIAEKPATTYTESWPTSGAITSSQDRSWSYLTGWQSGGFTVVSGQLECISDSGMRYARMGSALSGSDVYAQCVYKSFAVGAEAHWVGPMARKDSDDGTVTFYRAELFSYPVSSSSNKLFKVVTGTSTQLGSTSSTFSLAANDVVKLTCSGSAIKVYNNASENVSVTDTAISSGTYCGMTQYGGGGRFHVTDDWACSDLAAGATRPDLGLLLGVS